MGFLNKIMVEVSVITSVILPLRDGLRERIMTDGCTYSQIFERLQNYDVLDGMENILLDGDMNIIIISIDDDFSDVIPELYTRNDNELCKFTVAISSLTNRFNTSYMENYQLYHYYENNIDEIYKHKTSIRNIIFKPDPRVFESEKFDIVRCMGINIKVKNLTYLEIHNIIKKLNMLKNMKNIDLSYTTNSYDEPVVIIEGK